MNLPNLLLLICLFSSPVMAQKKSQSIQNTFFTLHNGIRGDSVYNTPAKQVALIKEIGYEGMEINQLENVEAFKPEMDRQGLAISSLYLKVDLDEPGLDSRLMAVCQSLRGSGVVLMPYLVSGKKNYPSSDVKGDSVAIVRLRELADLARTNGLQVAVYPHIWFWLERVPHALSLVQQVRRSNVGLCFNLPHFLAISTSEEITGWKTLLKRSKAHLKIMTICGATITPDKNPKTIWSSLIQPLGQGEFDTYALVRYAVKELNYTGPIGLQCYNLKGDKPNNLKQSLSVWNDWKRKLQANH